MIASLLLSKDYDSLLDVVAPIVLQEKDKYNDPFTQFVEALYEDFDFERAQQLVKEIVAVSQEDLLLKQFTSEI